MVGARTPENTRPVAPCRNTAMSAMESAPATMPATSADTFNPVAWPGPPATVSRRSASFSSPALAARAMAGTSPACDTRFGSSNSIDRTGNA